LNFTDKPTHEKPENITPGVSTPETFIYINIPTHTPENFPSMQAEDDSVSTFHPKLFEEGEGAGQNDPSNDQRKRKALIKASTLTDSKPFDKSDATSKMSDLASRISSIETDISKLTSQFQSAFNYLQKQSKLQADKQAIAARPNTGRNP
jgi:hypothetical protein